MPIRLFLTKQLLDDAETTLYRQIVNATRFPGVRMVVITPDIHYGYGVPVGCVLITDAESGAIAMEPVGYDIGCFTADTLIPLADGRSYPIGELAERGEAAPAYKSSQAVIEAVAGAGPAKVEPQLWPLASLKGADERKGKQRGKLGKGDAKKGRETKGHY